MSDTTTPNLALTLMENGSHENTWGDVTNDNLQRVEDKLTAETEISTTGGTTTLSSTEEYANVIDVAGVLASAATIVFSGRKGQWIIVNDTSGAFAVTAKVTGQTGVAITQGSAALVRCDGTDIKLVVAPFVSLSADLTAGAFYIKFNDLVGIKDANGNKVLVFGTTTSAVNYLEAKNAATAGNPAIIALGSDTDIGITLTPKGAGTVKVGATVVPSASDGAALGTGALMFSDLFLASGGVINFNNGDVLLTHASNALAFSGGTVSFDAVPNVAGSNMALLGTEDQTQAGGAIVTSKSLGTISTGTTALDMGARPLQHYTNNGAHTLNPGTNNGAAMVDITNGASAGAITTSGWTKVSGSFADTTNGHKFRCHCSVGNAGSLLVIQALQ